MPILRIRKKLWARLSKGSQKRRAHKIQRRKERRDEQQETT